MRLFCSNNFVFYLYVSNADKKVQRSKIKTSTNLFLLIWSNVCGITLKSKMKETKEYNNIFN